MRPVNVCTDRNATVCISHVPTDILHFVSHDPVQSPAAAVRTAVTSVPGEM